MLKAVAINTVRALAWLCALLGLAVLWTFSSIAAGERQPQIPLPPFRFYRRDLSGMGFSGGDPYGGSKVVPIDSGTPKFLKSGYRAHRIAGRTVHGRSYSMDEIANANSAPDYFDEEPF